MKQTQMMYISELDKANQTLKETLKERATSLSEPFVDEVLRETSRIENRPIINHNHYSRLGTLSHSRSFG